LPILVTALALAGLAAPAPAGQPQYRFLRPFAEEPSVVSVRHLLQDSHGFVWFVQQRTLYRYDGISVVLLETLADNHFTAMASDAAGNIWLGTQNGLMVWERRSQVLAPWRDPEDGTELPGRTTGLTVAPAGQVWAANSLGQIVRIDAATRKARSFRAGEIEPTATTQPAITRLLATAAGYVWLGTAEGDLLRYRPADDRFEKVPLSGRRDEVTALATGRDGRLWVGTRSGEISHVEEGAPRELRTVGVASGLRPEPTAVTALAEDPQGHLWIGTESGLKMLAQGATAVEAVQTNLEGPLDPTTTVVQALSVDRSGVIWVADSDSGVSTTSTRASAFEHWLAGTDEGRNLVTSITASKDGSLWVGTYKGGLTERLPSGRIVHHGLARSREVEDSTAMSLLVDRRDRVWIGTLRGGLSRFDRATGRSKDYSENPDDPTALNNNTVLSLFERPDGTLWVGTFDGGLNLMDPDRESFQALEHDPADPNSLSENHVRSVLEDSHGRLWVGTRTTGVNLRLPGRSAFRHYRHDPDDHRSLADDTVVAITEDRAGRIWLGTYGGLDRAVIEDGNVSFEHYGEPQGLAGRKVFSILEDDTGYLWLSTGQGISRFDVANGTFTNLTRSHGLPPGGYTYNAYARSADGTLHYGSNYGVTSFHPDEISFEPYAPQIVLTDVLKLNRSVGLPFDHDQEVTFSHRDSLVSFEFSLLDFISPDGNRYEHFLEGFDEGWIDLGSHHRVNYSNLPPGRYVFRARGANREGVWSAADATLAIRVLPPPWATWWAYGLYTAVACGLAVAYSRQQARKQRREALYTQRLEREVHRRTGELASQNEKLRYANELLEVASVTDSLTGVRNRRFLLTTIDQDIALVDRSFASEADESRQDSAFVFILFDLDGFKEINDQYGHSAGDLVLFQIRDLLNQACRSSDTLIRWGGDEFLIVAREATRAHVEALAERIRQSVADHLFDIGTSQPVQLTCSLGFACYPFVAANPRLYAWEEVVDIADRALYVAKRHGPNMWAGIFGTEHTEETPVEDLLVMINERPELLGAEGSIRLVTSRPTPAQTDLRSRGAKRQRVS